MPNWDTQPASPSSTYREDQATTTNTTSMTGGPVTNAGVNSTEFNATGQVVPVGDVEYMGISVMETSGSATAQVKVFSGTDNTGELIEIINLAGNESAREMYPNGVVANGIFVEVTSGAVSGALRWSE